MGALGDGQRDARIAEVVEAASHSRPAQRRLEVVLPEARRNEWVPGLVGEDKTVGPRSGVPSDMVGEQLGGHRRDGDRAHRGGGLGSLRNHSPDSSRMSCSVTRTLLRRRSTFALRSPTSSLQRMPESTAR